MESSGLELFTTCQLVDEIARRSDRYLVVLAKNLEANFVHAKSTQGSQKQRYSFYTSGEPDKLGLAQMAIIDGTRQVNAFVGCDDDGEIQEDED